MMISGIPYRLIHPTSQYSPGDTAEPFPKNMSPMSCDSDPGFRLTVPPRCRCGGPSSSISKITMKPRCGSASRTCAITSNRFRRNGQQGAWRQAFRTENGELALQYRRQHRLWLPAFALLIGTVSTNCAFPQQSPADLQQPKIETDVRNAQTAKQANTQCIEPAPLVSLEDYEGPMKKTVGFFARALERKAVNPPRYKPGVFLCSLETKDKFVLFLQDSLNPVAFLSTGFNAGLDQASDRDHAFGQGTKGSRAFGSKCLCWLLHGVLCVSARTLFRPKLRAETQRPQSAPNPPSGRGRPSPS